MNTDWHSLGQHDKRWYYLHVTEMEFDEGAPIATYEVFIEEDEQPVYAEVESVTTVGDWKSLPSNIRDDINKVVAELRKEHYHVEPDYEGLLQRQQDREQIARETWEFRNSIR